MANGISNEPQTKIYSFEAEQAVLGSVLFDPSSFSVAATHLKSDYFYYPQHKTIFSLMQQLDLSTGTIDLLMLLELLRKEKAFSGDDGGKQYLMQLSEAVPSASNIEAYCKIVKDKFYIRTLVEISNKIIDMAENSGEPAEDRYDDPHRLRHAEQTEFRR